MVCELDDVMELCKNGFEVEDALSLLSDPVELLQVADELRKRCCGKFVTYVINRNINFSNRCIGDCKFCAFRDRNGYILCKEDIIRKVEEAVEFGAVEICIQGGLVDGFEIEDYCEIIEIIKSVKNIHVHGFSPMEVVHVSRNSGMHYEDALKELKRSGLDSMPGTAAEILVDEVRRMICPSKLSTEEWCNVIITAHRLGIPTTATMMYGHVESMVDRIEHILMIREIQQITHGFTEFVLLPFLGANNELGKMCRPIGMMEHKIMHALARVLLYPHVRNIQASWVKLGKRGAQQMLMCGANDLGGTLMEENISRAAGGSHGQMMTPEEFERIIREIGRIPRRRGTIY